MLYFAVLKCTLFTVYCPTQDDVEPYNSAAIINSIMANESPLFVEVFSDFLSSWSRRGWLPKFS